MVFKRITAFADALKTARSGQPYEFIFETTHAKNVLFSCEVVGNRSFFSTEGVRLSAILKDYLNGLVMVTIRPLTREPNWKKMQPDFREVVWLSLKGVAPEFALQIFHDSDDVCTVRDAESAARLEYTVLDKVDNYVLLYFYHRPKLISKFIDDFPKSTARNEYYHSLLCLSMTGFLKLFRTDSVVLPLLIEAPVEPIGMAQTLVAKPASPKRSGLSRILSAIKKI
jgi:hypothetical protein